MLDQVTFWAERAAMVLDLALLARILLLRLHRAYIFILLFALLEVFYDAIGLLMGTRTEDFGRVLVMSKFLYAAVIPLAMWDLFEEAKPMVDKVRRMAMSRMISSLLFITIWALLIAAFTGGDESDGAHYFIRVAFVMWTGSIAAAIAFLWVMRRAIRTNDWQLPHNTSVWFRYFRLMLIIDAAAALLYMVLPAIKPSGWAETAGAISDPVLQTCGIALTAWCVFKLRAIPSDQPNVPARAAL